MANSGKEIRRIYSLTLGSMNRTHVDVELHNKWKFTFEGKDYNFNKIRMGKDDVYRLCGIDGGRELKRGDEFDYDIINAGRYIKARFPQRNKKRAEKNLPDQVSIEDGVGRGGSLEAIEKLEDLGGSGVGDESGGSTLGKMMLRDIEKKDTK